MARTANDPVTPGTTRVVYTGSMAGGLEYTNPVTGHTYTGGANSRDRYNDVLPEDLDYILGRGVFKKVEIPASETMTVAEKEALANSTPEANAKLAGTPESQVALTEAQRAANPTANVTLETLDLPEEPAQDFDGGLDPDPIVQDQDSGKSGKAGKASK